jgi:Protein of unknown function (DUF2877)
MRFQAISIGRHVPRGRFNGAVHSVFQRAANIRLPDERLLALLSPCAGNAPHGVRLAVPEDFAFSDHLAPGQRVGCRADVLRVAATAVAFDLGTAAPWDGDAPCRKIDWRRPSTVAAWRVAWHALWRRRSAGALHFPPAGSENAQSLLLLPDALSLAQATRVLCSERTARAVHRLIGRGPGLTPAGDDIIAGFLGALWSAIGSDRARGAFVRALGTAVERAAVATGAISRAHLDHALLGSLAEPLAEVRRQVGEGAPAPIVESAMAKALAVGHTSGEDGALGLLLGFAAWAPDALFASAVPRTAKLGGMPAREIGRHG